MSCSWCSDFSMFQDRHHIQWYKSLTSNTCTVAAIPCCSFLSKNQLTGLPINWLRSCTWTRPVSTTAALNQILQTSYSNPIFLGETKNNSRKSPALFFTPASSIRRSKPISELTRDCRRHVPTHTRASNLKQQRLMMAVLHMTTINLCFY